MSEAEQRETVIAEAQRWLRTPFRMGSGVIGCGVDCGRILTRVYGAAGVPVPADEDLPQLREDWFLHTSEEKYLAVISQFARPIETPQPGDIALFRMRHEKPGRPNGRVLAHSAIVVDWPERVIHAAKSGVEWMDASKEPFSVCEVVFLSPWA